MRVVQQTGDFKAWFAALLDVKARIAIVGRIDRLALGNPGDVKPVGKGVSEMRIHVGPGYRVYFGQTGKTIILLLCAGTKKSQAKDISHAQALLAQAKMKP